MSQVMQAEDRPQSTKHLERCPFPIPMGWYFVDFSRNLAPEEIRNVEMLDQEWVLFRGENGTVGMTDPYCPHLGAHMGHGGKVCGEFLRCPFHHWQWDAEGWNKDIPYGKVAPPIVKKKALLRTLPCQEKWGMIWCWYHPGGQDPQWELPSIPELEDSENYVEPALGSWEANTAIQELAENGADVAHLKFLHGQPYFPSSEFKFDWPNFYYDLDDGYIKGQNIGPGLSVAKFEYEGVVAVMISYQVPITTDFTRINMSFTHKRFEEGSKEAQIASHLVKHMVGEAEGEESAGFESVDFIVWNNKKYRPNPLLCDGDGPILKYREWFRKFYAGFEDPDKV